MSPQPAPQPRPRPIIFTAGHRTHPQYLTSDEAQRLERQDAIGWCYDCTDANGLAYDTFHLADHGEVCPDCRYPRVTGHCCHRCADAQLVAQEPRP